ncbi:uncharacterized protein [Eucyclogobius newberryi]|uniref:uncharacterized protein n=1 Tax=Eucyclogobius newberryi TaxID=166745 RepID=UPI003B5982C7
MKEERAHSYPDLKAALLTKFDVSPETYRQQFRFMTIPPGENPTETYHRLKGLYRRWVRREQHTKEQIGEQIILEQLLRVFPADIRTWVKEHEPTERLAAAKLALQYLNARRGGPAAYEGGSGRQQSSQPRPVTRTNPHAPGDPGLASSHCGPGKELICFYCQQTGHKASLCPLRKAKLTGACYTPCAEDGGVGRKQQRFKEVTINGESVIALVDSGSFLTLVRRDLVPTGLVDYSRQEDICCVHGDRHSYPTELTLVVDEQPYLLTVGVVERLPVAAILGWDLPVLLDVLMEEGAKDCPVTRGLSGAVITRAQARAGVTPTPEKEPDPEPFSTLDSSLFEEGTKGRRKSRRQRRFEKGLKSREPDCKEELTNDTWEVSKDIRVLQREDESLKPVFVKVVVGPNMTKGDKDCYNLENDVLYAVGDCVKRLVVPMSCRKMILHLAHTLPWAGHLGHRAYLQPLPVISTPFRRVAMDIVDPLVRSSGGHQYILLFSRVGVPDEIVTDQGTNFTSRLMQHFHRQLGITPIKTTPYHPQTDGLVERFNQTLKKMLRKFVADIGRDWDKWLPYLLFAYREVPQASTGFSPFELLYGWDVQGPLDLLLKTWEVPATTTSDRSVV